jgi:hypothetical protein
VDTGGFVLRAATGERRASRMTPHLDPVRQRSLALDSLAHVVSEVLAPVVLAYVTCVAVSVRATPTGTRGLVTGLVIATFCAGLPYAVIVGSSRRRLLSGRNVPDLRERPTVLALCALSAVLGVGAAFWLDAPRAVVALVVATAAGLAVAALISTKWKLSIHTAGAAGAVTALALTVSPWVLSAWLLVAAVGWARVRLDSHDKWQVLGGALIGAGVTTSVMLALV